MEANLVLALLAVLAFVLVKATVMRGGWSLPEGVTGEVDHDFSDDLRKTTNEFFEEKRRHEFVNGD